MTESFKINVEFRIEGGFSLPQHIRVSQSSYVEWNIIDMNVYESGRRYYEVGLRFQLYFQNKSPFIWTKKTADFQYPRPPISSSQIYRFEPLRQVLASGVAAEKGDFKYGVKVLDIRYSTVLYDDDPWIHVF